jgi:hypothetical protein
MSSKVRYLPALVHFVWQEAVRGRLNHITVTVFAVASFQFALAAAGSARAAGLVFIIGLWALSAPLCRGWVEADVGQGYAAFWLQKPVVPAVFYFWRLSAHLIWSFAVTVAIVITSLPAVMLPALGLDDLAELTLAGGWMPPLLVVLSFLGSAIGAGNAALFAYTLLIGGLALPGLSVAVELGRVEWVLQLLLPPATVGLDAVRTMREIGVLGAVIQLWPLVVYGIVCAALGLGAVRRIPARLGRVR